MNKFLLTLCLSVLTVIGVNAQLKEGHVKYKIDMSSDDPEMEMQMQMMQGSTLEMFFSDNKSRTDMSMGGLMTMTTIVDVDGDKMLMLMGGMMGNKAVTSSISEMEEENGEEPEFEVELIDETKEIAGYNCKKAILSDEEGNETTFWYTEEIFVNKTGQSFLNENVPGFPLEFAVDQGGMIMTMSATEFKDKIDNKEGIFDMSIPEGYEEMTMEDLQGMGM